MMSDSATTRRIAIIYSNTFKNHVPPPNTKYPECPERMDVCVKALKESNEISPLIDWIEPHPVSSPDGSERRDQVLTNVKCIHSSTYLDTIENASKAAREFGSSSIGDDTYASTDTYDVALLAAGAWMEAVDRSVSSGSAVWALTRPPGHHAVPAPVNLSAGSGFCIFSNAAIAARYALTKPEVSNVAILDFDVHHGHGTEEAVKDIKNVRLVSSHQCKLYPRTEAKGRSGKYQHILNVDVPSGSGIESYRATFENEMLPFLLESEPDLVIVSAGFDALDIDSLGELKFKAEDYRLLTELLVDKAGEGTAFVFGLEGGYSLDKGGLGEAVRECVAGYCIKK